MKLKVTYEYDEKLKIKKVTGFSCVIPSQALNKYLGKNQIYVEGSSVPMSFYKEWKFYEVTDLNQLTWNGILYTQK